MTVSCTPEYLYLRIPLYLMYLLFSCYNNIWLGNLHWDGGKWWTSICDRVYCGIRYILQLKLRSTVGPQVFWWGVLTPLLLLHSCWAYNKAHSSLPSGGSQGSTGTILGHDLGYARIRCKHRSLMPPSVSINTYLIHKWMCIRVDASTHIKEYESDENKITIRI